MSVSALRIGILEGVIHALDRLPGRRAATGPAHLETGRRGELAAYFYLRRQGYVIVARDWKSGLAPGDIDLIGWDLDTLCFVEVKTRTTKDVAAAEAAVDDHKRRTLRRLAGFYVRQQPEGTATRFDILSIYYVSAAGGEKNGLPKFDLFRNAFQWG